VYPWHVGPGEMYTAVPRTHSDRRLVVTPTKSNQSTERCRSSLYP
jgi:hypothetical protein